ncbi:MAG: hypothetical protein U1E60_22620 [Reyranellaceae bacterium]
MRILACWLTVVGSLLASAAAAQMACAPSDRPIDPYYEKDAADEWPQEAQRFKANEQMVARERDRLRLALDGGKSIELVDCPYGDAGYHYLFERYDQAARFYVVRKVAPDELSYMLVMMPTGRLFAVSGAPIWTSEKSRFLTVGCSLQPPRGALVIHAPDGAELAKEAEFELPCDSESCAARWDHQSWISVTCTPRDGGGKKGKEFVLMRSNDGKWNRYGR